MAVDQLLKDLGEISVADLDSAISGVQVNPTTLAEWQRATWSTTVAAWVAGKVLAAGESLPGDSDRIVNRPQLYLATVNGRTTLHYHDGATTGDPAQPSGNWINLSEVWSSSEPATPAEGQAWFDAAQGILRIYDGNGTWHQLGQADDSALEVLARWGESRTLSPSRYAVATAIDRSQLSFVDWRGDFNPFVDGVERAKPLTFRHDDPSDTESEANLYLAPATGLPGRIVLANVDGVHRSLEFESATAQADHMHFGFDVRYTDDAFDLLIGLAANQPGLQSGLQTNFTHGFLFGIHRETANTEFRVYEAAGSSSGSLGSSVDFEIADASPGRNGIETVSYADSDMGVQITHATSGDNAPAWGVGSDDTLWQYDIYTEPNKFHLYLNGVHIGYYRFTVPATGYRMRRFNTGANVGQLEVPNELGSRFVLYALSGAADTEVHLSRVKIAPHRTPLSFFLVDGAGRYPVSIEDLTLTATTATLTWAAPTLPDGVVLTGYDVEYKQDSSSIWIDAGHTGTAAVDVISSLVSGQSYDFRVRAVVEVSGQYTQIEGETLSQSTPSEPQNLAATPGANSFALAWDAPSSNGGSVVTSYEVQYRIGANIWTQATSTQTSRAYSLTNLSFNVRYEIRVRAINANGGGQWATVFSTTLGSAPAQPGPISIVFKTQSQISFRWSTPASDGGHPITSYEAFYQQVSPSGSRTAIPLVGNQRATTTTRTARGLSSYTEYDLIVRAVNSVGTSSERVHRERTRGRVPGAVTNLAVSSATTSSVNLSWTAPADVGDSSITGYQVYYRWEVSGVTNSRRAAHTGTGVTATVTGLTSGIQYTFTVYADNDEGTSAGTELVKTVPSAAPSVPRDVAAAAASTSLTVTWTAPASNGGAGATITDYDVRYREDGTTTWLNWPHASTTRSSVITGLASSTEYEVEVRARNSDDVLSDWSPTATFETAAPVATPGAPRNLRRTGSTSSSISVAWDAPSSDGGAAVSDYDIRYRVSGTTAWSDFAHVGIARTSTITGLSASTTYEIQVAARNTGGLGSYTTSLSTATRAVATAPSAPVLTSTSRSASTVTLSWTLPSSPGAAVTDYDVRYKRTSQSSYTTVAAAIGTSRTYTVTGLAATTSYHFQVRAENSAGESAWSNQITVTTTSSTTAPGAPTNLRASNLGETSFTLQWNAPASNGGSAITDYDIQYRAGISGSWTNYPFSGTALSASIRNLTVNTFYQFQVRAKNAVGTGAWSATYEITLYRRYSHQNFTLNIGENDINELGINASADFTIGAILAGTGTLGANVQGHRVSVRSNDDGTALILESSGTITGSHFSPSYRIVLVLTDSGNTYTGLYTLHNFTVSGS